MTLEHGDARFAHIARTKFLRNGGLKFGNRKTGGLDVSRKRQRDLSRRRYLIVTRKIVFAEDCNVHLVAGVKLVSGLVSTTCFAGLGGSSRSPRS